MRVLFVTTPEKAHFLAMVPVAWALRAAGHEVLVASQPAFVPVVRAAGLPAAGVGRDADLWRLLERDPRLRDWTWEPERGLPHPYDAIDDPAAGTWERLRDGYEEAMRTWHRPANMPIVAALADLGSQWRPHLVVWEPLAMAGAVAATACGALHARLLWSLDVFGATRRRFASLATERVAGEADDPVARWLAPWARRYGRTFDEDMVNAHLTIDQHPPSLGLDTGLDRLHVRHVPYGGPSVVPDWLRRPPDRPRVALTMGISLSEHRGHYGFSAVEALEALAALDVEVVATVRTPGDAAAKLPRNVRLTPFVPFQALAATCAAVVHHGGFGTALTAAGLGVPQLVLPHDFDGPAFARAAVRQGASLALPADAATGDDIAAAVDLLLTVPAFRRRAGALRAEMTVTASPREAVTALVGRVEDHRFRSFAG